MVVGNKQDLYQPEHNRRLVEYVESKTSSEVAIRFSQQGQLPIEILQGPTAVSVQAHHHHGDGGIGNDFEYTPIPECGFVKAVNEGEGYQSLGWRFEPTRVFNRNRLFSFFNSIDVERMKAVFITESGVFGYNLTRDALSEITLDDCLESRIEIIASTIVEQWEEQLFACIEQAS